MGAGPACRGFANFNMIRRTLALGVGRVHPGLTFLEPALRLAMGLKV